MQNFDVSKTADAWSSLANKIYVPHWRAVRTERTSLFHQEMTKYRLTYREEVQRKAARLKNQPVVNSIRAPLMTE